MLVNSDYLLKDALKLGYAVPAYNINNLEWAKFILEACQEDKSPVILAATPSAITYFGGYKVVYSVVSSLIDCLNISIPVVLHLDHAENYEECKEAIDCGFTSVMINNSGNIENSILVTNKVIKYAKEKNVSVEAEIENILDGKEEGENYTNIEDAYNFVSRTNVDSFAPSIGNKHGFYGGQPNLNFELLGAICKETKVPLVLHSASFIDDNKIRTAIFCGISKININTDLQDAWSCSVRKFLDSDKSVCDPRLIIKSGEHALKRRIHYLNNLFGSKNRAN